ncbi:hypothetical protein ECTPHS_02416 [Ectothiorhodospira sp. PHS-1]|nr:hypothetical protein ECTPHS_02416 [Ectothiorhodospira sp. PHS-1]
MDRLLHVAADRELRQEWEIRLTGPRPDGPGWPEIVQARVRSIANRATRVSSNHGHILRGLPLTAEDVAFIQRCLAKIPRQRHREVLGGYRRRWREAFKAEGADHRRENAGRRTANTYLVRCLPTMADVSPRRGHDAR